MRGSSQRTAGPPRILPPDIVVAQTWPKRSTFRSWTSAGQPALSDGVDIISLDLVAALG